jgi:ribosomal protein L11 methyltransferase
MRDPMALTRLSISIADAQNAGALSDVLETLDPAPSAQSIFRHEPVRGWRLDAYYHAAPDLALIVAAAQIVLPSLSEADLVLAAVPEENWVAVSQAALPPVAAGPFLIHGSHDRAAARGKRYAIEIEAGEAFGTAHHASTRGCLLAFDRLSRSRPFRRVLDLGCGSGVLGIAAAKRHREASVIATDIDPIAIEVARANARFNGVAAQLRLAVATGLDHALLRDGRRIDLVFANILAEPLIALAPRLSCRLAPGGYVILSGLLNSEKRTVRAAYVASSLKAHSALSFNGWTVLTLQRP